MTDAERIEKLEGEVKRLFDTVSTLIHWIAQSSGSPLSIDNAQELIGRLHPRKRT